jgi:hypothetical protein
MVHLISLKDGSIKHLVFSVSANQESDGQSPDDVGSSINDDDEDKQDSDCHSDPVAEWSPNGNTSAGVVRLSLLALSATIQVMENIDKEELAAWMSCSVMQHHLLKVHNARRAVLKIQAFYWHHVHQMSENEEDYSCYGNFFYYDDDSFHSYDHDSDSDFDEDCFEDYFENNMEYDYDFD